MLKNVKLGLLALAMGATMVACQNEGENNSDAAADAPAVQPVANEANSIVNDQATAVPAGPTTSITFEESEFNFGTVDAGAIVEHTYAFTNTGSEPLVISNAKGSCGCTVPEWPKEPVMPGKTAILKVRYDTKRVGPINKSVTITSNAVDNPTMVLRIKGKVNAKASGATSPVKKVSEGAPVNN